MIVCVCHRVSDRDIAREVGAGCDSFEALQQTLRVATRCGACRDCAQAEFSRLRAVVAAAPPVPQAVTVHRIRPTASSGPIGRPWLSDQAGLLSAA